MGALRTIECLQGHHVQWHRLGTVHVRQLYLLKISIFKTCFSAPLISLRALAARSGVSKVEAETGKGEGELPCFATGCQALPADPRAQWLKFLFFVFVFAFYNIMDGPGGY